MSPSQPPRPLLHTLASLTGNVLEWYDFSVFGFFSDVISKVFFPPQAGNSALMESFAVFGGAFLMRPVGGVLLGYIGDTHGRKRALELSIFLMAIPTFVMGCLPSYERIGGWAVVLLVLTRMLQGMSVGGQLMSSLVFTVEGSPKEKWGLNGSFVMMAANLGTLVGGIVAWGVRASLTEDQLLSWGWRLPFLSGVCVVGVGVYLKNNVEELDHLGQNAIASSPNPSSPIPKPLPPKHNPLKDALFKNTRQLIAASLVPMIWCCSFYLGFVWLSIFMKDLVEPPYEDAFKINSLSLFFGVVLTFPAGGILSDMYGRNKIMMIGGYGLMVYAPIGIYIISTAGSNSEAFFAQTAFGLILSLYGAPMLTWMVESFPVESRLTSISIGYNVAQALIGGTTPAIATVLVDTFGPTAPGFYVSFICVLSLIGLSIVSPRREEGGGRGFESNTLLEVEFTNRGGQSKIV